MEIRNIKIDQIKIENRLWEINEKRIQPLAESIEKVGLMNPITVLESDGEYILIAGEHRINAYKYLKWDTIPCHVYQREFDDIEKDKAKCVIMEVDENLMRKIRDVYEESYLLYQRKQAYEKLYPSATKEAKQKLGASKTNGTKDNLSEADNVKTFAQDTAEKLGVSERSINRKLRRATILTEQMGEQVQRLKLNNAAIDNIIKGKDDDAREAAKIYLDTLEKMANEVDDYKELSKILNAECRVWTSIGYDISDNPIFYANMFKGKMEDEYLNKNIKVEQEKEENIKYKLSFINEDLLEELKKHIKLRHKNLENLDNNSVIEFAMMIYIEFCKQTNETVLDMLEKGLLNNINK